jgi:UDP-GlcNAc:undecaprenyl-phosphate GlcNAc-1-phosphate transferase
MSIFLIIILNTLLYLFYYRLVKIINIYDEPDNARKLHVGRIPVVGGFICFVNIIAICIISDLDYNANAVIFLSSVFFLVGFLDDKYGIQHYKRLIFFSSLLFFFLFFHQDFLIKNFKIYSYEFTFNNFFSFIFTVLSVIFFIIFLNMFDGINLQSLIFILILTLFLIIKNIFANFYILFFIPLILLMYLNFKNKLFLGDGGIYLIAILNSFSLIKAYNIGVLKADEIFLICIFPAVDCLRVLAERGFNKKNILSPDRIHIHHLILNKFSYLKTILILFFFLILPFFLNYFMSSFYTICVFIFLYYFFLLILKKYIYSKSNV